MLACLQMYKQLVAAGCLPQVCCWYIVPCFLFLVEHVHQCRQALRGCRAVGSDWGMWSWRDLQSSPASGSADSGLCPESGTKETSLGHVCLLPYPHQRGKMHRTHFLYCIMVQCRLTHSVQTENSEDTRERFPCAEQVQVPDLVDLEAYVIAAVEGKQDVFKTLWCVLWNSNKMGYYL